ncbi:MAG: choice-of-anchor B family protein [Gemmatimonadaceae bacterium]|nr:choice-of-anchor B family protein [Gemmatimonadaceae bacterium]
MRSVLWLALLSSPAALSASTPVDSIARVKPSGSVSETTHIVRDDAQRAVFGAAVAISGTAAFVGEPRGQTSGTVHVYTRAAAGWRATGTLKAPSGTPNDGFGNSLATDGSTLLVGQVGAPNVGDSARGVLHVFRRSGTSTWTHAATLRASSGVARAGFSSAIAMAGDMLYVGAPGEGAGVVYVFRKNASGEYEATGRMTGEGSVANDAYGTSIAVDGDRLAIGAPARATRRGGVYMYRKDEGGAWKHEALVVSARGADNARFGQAVQLTGTRLAVGAPGALPIAGMGGNAAAGLVHIFDYSEIGEIWRERQSFTQSVYGPARLGTTVVRAGDELWISAPTAERTGAVQRLRQSTNGTWTLTALTTPELEPGAGFGASVAVSGTRAVVGMPNDAGSAGSVMFLERSASGAWSSRGVLYPLTEAKVFRAVQGKEVQCGANGKVGEFECGNTGLMSFLPISAIGGKRGTNMNDNWGWTDPITKREIALLGRTDGTSFVDVTDPANPRYLGNLPKTKGSPASAWRDMKVYKDHVFIVSDNAAEHGMQVFDLTRLRTVKTPQLFTPDVTYDRINSAHNIVANEETGFMYTVGNSGGGETCGGGYHMIDVRTPKKPKFAGCFGDPKTGSAGTGYSHDAQCVKYRGPDTRYTGKEICVGSNENAISIADLTDKKNPVAISRASYPNVAYAHQAWFTDDHRFLYLNDEGDESTGKGEAAKGTRTLVWDLADLSDPILVKEHVGTSRAIDHNLYVKGDRMYQANYTSGLRILDISDPKNPKEVGFMDTHPGDDGTPSFNGAWSVYPYFKSGAIVVTSIGEGVFFVRDMSRKVVP